MALIFKGGPLFKKVGWWGVIVLVVGFYGYHVVTNFSDIPTQVLDVSSLGVWGASIFLPFLGISITATIWYVLLRDAGFPLSWKSAQVVYLLAQFGKYLPGNVGQHVGRVALARNLGIPVAITIKTVFFELLWGVSVGAALGFFSVFYIIESEHILTNEIFNPVNTGVLFVFLFLMPWLLVRFLKLLPIRFRYRIVGEREVFPPSLFAAFVALILFITCFLLFGVALKLQANFFFEVENVNYFELVCIFSLAWLAGFLMPGAPGGLGVRESVMLLLFTPLMGAGPAIGLGVTFRVATTIADAIAFCLGLFFRRYYKIF